MTKKLTQEQLEVRVLAILGDEFEVRSEYQGTDVEFDVYHKICKGTWQTSLKRLRSNSNSQNCKLCSHKKVVKKDKGYDRLTKLNYREVIRRASKGTLEATGIYAGALSDLEVRCTIHNHLFKTRPTYITRGVTVCRLCNAENLSNKQKKPVSVFDKQLRKKHKGKIIRLGEYINTHTHIDLKCLECNTEFSPEPNAVLRLSGCPACAYSKGENEIEVFLKEKGIAYEPQKRFEGCFHKRQLLFDFYLPELNIIIEYHGAQHYRPIEFFGGLVAFKSQQLRDKIKKDFAKASNIPMYIIPYTKLGDTLIKELKSIIQCGS